MIDATKQTNSAFLQLLRGTAEYQQIIASAEEWEEVVAVIDSMEISYTAEQLAYVKEKQWD